MSDPREKKLKLKRFGSLIRFPELVGKTIKECQFGTADGGLFISLQFTDKTYYHVNLEAILAAEFSLSRWTREGELVEQGCSPWMAESCGGYDFTAQPLTFPFQDQETNQEEDYEPK